MSHNYQGEEKAKEFILLKNIKTDFKKSWIRFSNYIEKNVYRNIKKDNPLHLCPVNEIEHKEYENAILSGIKEKDVKNIAITGTYGSGKSSIIKNFQNNHPEYNYLFISMATFEKDKTTPTPPKNDDTTEVEYELEKNILQQIIYATKYDLVPKSRFSKLKNNSFYKLLLFFGIFLFSIYKIFYENPISEFAKDSLFVSRFVFLFCLYGIIKYLYIKVSSFKISQLIFKDLELNLFKEDDSAFNKYIDEIIYHFQGNKIDVVILEDIDRFNDIEIFNKLRELNLLLNNSNEISRKITFIYAIRDDLFEKSEDRTKFFDTLIPVIPYVSSANIGSKFVEILEELGLIEKKEVINNKTDKTESEDTKSEKDTDKIEIKLDKKIIFDLSLFVTNMREVNTIITEYQLYQSILKQEKIKPTNLMAIMFYKVKYPKDFCDLQFDKGTFYDVIQSKSLLKSLIINNLNEEIKSDSNKIIQINEIKEQEAAKTILDLNKIFITKFILKYPTISHITHGNQYQLSQFIDVIKNKEKFEEVFNVNKLNMVVNNSWQTLPLWTNEEINEYNERKDIVLNKKNKKIEKFEEEINMYNQEIQEIKKFSLSEVVNKLNKYTSILDKETKDLLKKIEDNRLIKYLINNNLIDETNYHLYISHFIEGQKTKADNDFLLDLKSSKYTYKPHYSIINIELILEHIREELDNNLILNVKLFEFIYEKGIDETFKSSLLNSLIKLDYYENFINDMLHKKEALDFIDDIINYDEEFWVLIEKSSLISKEKKDFVARHLMTYHTADVLKRLNINNSLGLFVAIQQASPLLFLSENEKEKLFNNISELNVKFDRLDFSAYTKESMEFIYKNNLYKFTPIMINQFIELFNNGEKFEISEYTTLKKNIKLSEMSQYIEKNINSFIEDYYLSDDVANNNETSEYITKLLSNKNITLENRGKVIEKTDAKLESIVPISEVFWTKLFQTKKVKGDIKNLINYADYESKDNVTLFNFLDENCNEIFDGEYILEEIQEILEDACGSSFLSLETLKVVKNKTKFEFNISDYVMINEQILENLIEANLIVFDYDNIEWVNRKCTKELKHKYIFNNLDKFTRDSNATFTSPQLALDLINDLDYNNQQKLKLIDKVYIKDYQSDEFIEASIKIIRNSTDVVLPKEYLVLVINRLSNDNEKFDMIKRFERNVNKENIFEFLHYLKNPISKIYENKEKVTVHRDNFTIEIANFLSNFGVARFSANENTDKITIIKIN